MSLPIANLHLKCNTGSLLPVVSLLNVRYCAIIFKSIQLFLFLSQSSAVTVLPHPFRPSVTCFLLVPNIFRYIRYISTVQPFKVFRNVFIARFLILFLPLKHNPHPYPVVFHDFLIQAVHHSHLSKKCTDTFKLKVVYSLITDNAPIGITALCCDLIRTTSAQLAAQISGRRCGACIKRYQKKAAHGTQEKTSTWGL